MASSQVEIASSSPFGYVLRDRNHCSGYREGNNVFQRNIKGFVMDHFNMSMSSDGRTNENSNSNCNGNNNNNNNNNNNVPSSISKASKRNKPECLHFTRSNHNDNKDKQHESSLASLISPRHSRLLDRWAARQAREMVSNLENEAELLAMPNSSNNRMKNNKNNDNDQDEDNNNIIARSRSSGSDDVSSEPSSHGIGASSLVQIWEKRLSQTNGSKDSKPITLVPTGKSSPQVGSCNNENALFSLEEQCRGGSEAGEFASSSCDHDPPGNEEPFPDWESDRTAPTDQSFSPQGRFSSSEVAERDRVSVADLIKRLTSSNQGQSPTHSLGDDNDHEGLSGSVTCSPCRERGDFGFAPEHLEHRAFLPQVTCPPRIRGRQAFNDLLMQLERDRQGELNNLSKRGAVSKFTHRGRIQSMLRLKLLQRGVAANHQSIWKSAASEINRQPQGSAIMQLREKFSTGVEHRTAVQAEVAEPRSSSKEIVNSIIELDSSPATNQLSKETWSQTAHGPANHSLESTQKSMCQTSMDDHKKETAHPSSDVTLQETCFETQHDDAREIAPPMTDQSINEMTDKAERSNQQNAMAETSYYERVEEEETSNSQHYAESNYDGMAEELDTADMNYYESSYDWISEISRPRSYWEERRQAWYREMLDTESHNEDIRKLLERRTVSDFLSSDFRERMDRLMESHRGTQAHLISRQDDEEDNQGLMAVLHERMRSARIPQEEEERRNEEEEQEEEEKEEAQEHEEESLISSSYQEVGDYYNQSSSPAQMTTWSYRDNEASDDFDRVLYSSSQPSQSHSSYQDSRRNSSSTNHHSIEMELIYDLRGHMEQLYHEMAELRKSMKSCMAMQMQLQQSMNREVHTAKEEKKSHNRAPKKGNCCICYEMKVDSVLYRCGHMCTCLKCANELQWNSGKCPICRAKIVDVVRVYVDF